MLWNLFRSGVRNLVKHPGFSLLNILGFSLSMAACFFIILYLLFAYSFDTEHRDADRLYRLTKLEHTQEGSVHYALTGFFWADAIRKYFPEVEQVVRLSSIGQTVFRHQGRQYYEEGVFYADSNFFDMFQHRFIYGDPATCLNEPHSMVITREVSERYFGDMNPVGTVMETDIKPRYITGVIENPPPNQHFKFNAIISNISLVRLLEERYPTRASRTQRMHNANTHTLVKLAPHTQPEQFYQKWPAFFDSYMRIPEMQKQVKPVLENIASIHFQSQADYDLAQGNASYLVALLIILIFMLVLSVVNYVNMSTARAIRRAREIGIKKVMGSSRFHLILQFLIESVALALISALIGLIIFVIAFETMGIAQKIQMPEYLSYYLNFRNILLLAAFATFTGLLSGIYPAYMIASFDSIKAIKNQVKQSRPSRYLRKSLVYVQFVISISIIVATLLILHQIQFIENKNLGFDRAHVVKSEILFSQIANRYATFRNEVKRMPGIIDMTQQDLIHTLGVETAPLYVNVFKDDEIMELTAHNLTVDFNFIDFFNLEIINGRAFDRSLRSDSLQAFIVNEEFVKKAGLTDPIGQEIKIGSDGDLNNGRGTIIGVLKNFNHTNLKQEMFPLVMYINNELPAVLYTKVAADKHQEAIAALQAKWESFEPERPFNYAFLEDELEQYYRSDINQSELLTLFSVLCIIVSIIGLLGLTAFSTAQRTRELGIRKVLGCSKEQIVTLIYKDIFVLSALALITAIPLGYFAYQQWVSDFAFRAPLYWKIFLIIPLGVFILSFFAVSYHAVRAALVNPVEVIRSE